jgi:hypothetical protein
MFCARAYKEQLVFFMCMRQVYKSLHFLEETGDEV